MKVATPASVSTRGPTKAQPTAARLRTGSLSIPGAVADGGEEPYSLNADLLHVRVIQGADDKAHVSEVIAEGSAYLTQSHGEKDAPLIIDGNRIDVQNRSETDQDMVVSGQPAHVRDRGSIIQGNRIRFNRQQNTADVEGVGRLQLP